GLRRKARWVGLAALVLVAVGGFMSPERFLRSWLFAYLFWLGVAIGCLSVTMIQHLTGGAWGVLICRILEAGGRTLYLFWLAFLPVVLGLPRLYAWARPETVAADPLPRHNAPYLNPAFFDLRAAFYFLTWAALAHFLSKWSRDLDRDSDRVVARRLRSLSGGGLVLLGLTITFASIDWAMSLEAHWFSSIYGMVFMVGEALSALCFAVVVLAVLGDQEPFSRVVHPGPVHDLGKLMLAFIMLWAYVVFSQFLIIWSGNLPEEIAFYRLRLDGGWG